MPFTLAQYAMTEKNPLRKGALLVIAQEGVVTDLIPWRGIDTLSETGVWFPEVPSPAYIPIGGTINEQTVQGRQVQFSTYEMAMHMDIPVQLEDRNADQVVRASVQQTKLALRGAAYVVNNRFINGDQAVTADGFNGIRTLVSNMDARQIVAPTAQLNFTSSYTSANAQALFNLMDRLAWSVDGHKPDAYFANSQFIFQFQSCIRQEKLLGLDYNWQDAGLNIDDPRTSQNTASRRPAYMWRGVPMYDLGYEADQSSQVIGNSYTHTTGSDETEIYAVKIDPSNIEGLQSSPLNVREWGLLPDSETYRYRLTWTHGLASWGPRAISMAIGVAVSNTTV